MGKTVPTKECDCGCHGMWEDDAPTYKTWIGEDGIEYESCRSDDGNIVVTMPVVSDEQLLIMAEEAKERRRIRNGSDGSMGLLHPHSKD